MHFPGRMVMRKPRSVSSLENLGTVRLSEASYMRDSLHCEIADLSGVANIQRTPSCAIKTAARLSQELLELLNQTLGRIGVFSGFRSPEVNRVGSERKRNSASREVSNASPIFDYRDAGRTGGRGCGGSTPPCGQICFFPRLSRERSTSEKCV